MAIDRAAASRPLGLGDIQDARSRNPVRKNRRDRTSFDPDGGHCSGGAAYGELPIIRTPFGTTHRTRQAELVKWGTRLPGIPQQHAAVFGSGRQKVSGLLIREAGDPGGMPLKYPRSSSSRSSATAIPDHDLRTTVCGQEPASMMPGEILHFRCIAAHRQLLTGPGGKLPDLNALLLGTRDQPASVGTPREGNQGRLPDEWFPGRS